MKLHAVDCCCGECPDPPPVSDTSVPAKMRPVVFLDPNQVDIAARFVAAVDELQKLAFESAQPDLIQAAEKVRQLRGNHDRRE